MQLSIDNYEKVLSKEVIKAALKQSVRECDDINKGHFIAYVDEGKETFDVSLTIEKNKDVSEHSCDCRNGNKFCTHKTAVLAHIAQNKDTKALVKNIKKTSKADNLLSTIDEPELKKWLRELLGKNRDIELAFIHRFSGTTHQYTPEEITQITSDAVKAVVKNKRNIDNTQLKKIVELWAEVHKAVLEQYLNNLGDEVSFINLHTLICSCQTFMNTIHIKSNRIEKYVEETLQRTTDTLNNILAENTWTKAITFYSQHLFGKDYILKVCYMNHLGNIFSISSAPRRDALLAMMVEQFEKSKPKSIYNGDTYSRFIYTLVEKHGVFAKYFHLFRPLNYQNEFNTTFIKDLIKISKEDLAIKYCLEIINKNSRDDYNLPYLKILKEVYVSKKDDNNLAKVLVQLFPFTYDFDDFQFILRRMTGDIEKKAWQQKVMSKARIASRNYDKRATEFCFRLFDSEKKYKKMIDYIDSMTPYALIDQYFEPMVLTDKEMLVNRLLERSENYHWGHDNTSPNDPEIFSRLLEGFMKHYAPGHLRAIVLKASNNRFNYHKNKFLEFLEKEVSLGMKSKLNAGLY